jgi:Glycosyltransferase
MICKSICIICDGYPTEKNESNTFIKQLVITFSELGIKCIVIAPCSITSGIINKKQLGNVFEIEKTQNGNEIHIYRPRFISCSNKIIFGVNTYKFTKIFFGRAVKKVFNKLINKPDVLYAHFLVPAGLIASSIGMKHKIPVFYANGESSVKILDIYKKKRIDRILNYFSGVISVSTFNKQELINMKLIEEDKIVVFPNGIDNNLFYKRNKEDMRNELGFNRTDFIVVFVGHFIERKGSERLSKALDSLPDIKSIFIGSGKKPPLCQNQLFCGKLLHNEIPKYLNAADVFVLPTLAEGCCNAIIEAMACGLPVISSDLPFNDDILTEENSIRINIQDVDAIRQAIMLLRDNPELRSKMSEAALVSSSRFNINNRANNIIDFINCKIENGVNN